MSVPAWTRSIRFRLTLIYSVALFVLGAIVLGATYMALREALDDEPVSAKLIRNQVLPLNDGRVLIGQQELLVQYTSLETLANERALEQLRRYSFVALGGLFVMSLGVGWVVAGRALRPIDRINAVAREITATDLSRRIDLQGPDDELTRLAATFDDMLGRLDWAFESQRQFIHEASHELRNPLATIRTNIEVGLADPASTADDLRQTAEVVDRSAQRIGRVVDDLLVYARSGVPEREQQLVDLSELVAEVAEEFAGLAESSAVRVELNLARRSGIRGDADGLRRVVANLLANAIEHSPSGSTVRVSVTSESGRVRVTVDDNGPGVLEADRDRLFERSWRGADVAERRPSGSGLGLTIARDVARAHGGEAWVEDPVVGPGARFIVEVEGSEEQPVADSL